MKTRRPTKGPEGPRAPGRPRTLGASVAINTRLYAWLYAELAGVAAAAHKPMSVLVRDALVEWLAMHKEMPGAAIAAKPRRKH